MLRFRKPPGLPALVLASPPPFPCTRTDPAMYSVSMDSINNDGIARHYHAWVAMIIAIKGRKKKIRNVVRAAWVPIASRITPLALAGLSVALLYLMHEKGAVAGPLAPRGSSSVLQLSLIHI